MIVKNFDIQVYDFKLKILITSKEEDKDYLKIFNRLAKKNKLIECDETGYSAIFTPSQDDKNHLGMMAFRNYEIKIPELIHELVHCVDYIRGIYNIPDKFGDDEPVAYLSEYISRLVLNKFKNSSVVKIEY